MSYSTRVEFHFEDDAPPFEIVEACVRSHFDAEQYAVDDIVVALRRGWDDGVVEFARMESSDIEGFMLGVSRRLPDCRMCVRGSGEEWRDYWLREFSGGKIAFTAGPFIEGKKPGFFRYYFGDKNAEL